MTDRANPFANEVWVRNAIATGAITPPHTDMLSLIHI